MLASIFAPMSSKPTSEQIQSAISAGNVFNSRADLVKCAKALEGFDFDSYDGVWAFWNGTTVGAVASDPYSKALQTAVIDQGQCSQRADQIMNGDDALKPAGTLVGAHSLPDEAEGAMRGHKKVD